MTAPKGEDPYVRAARLESELARAREEVARIKATRSFRVANTFMTFAATVRGRRAGRGTGTTPAVPTAPTRLLVLAVDADAVRVADAVAVVARVMHERAVRAVFVVTNDDLAALSAAGIEYEFVPATADYRREFPDRDYEAFLAGRVADACAWFGPDVVLDVELLTGHPSVVRALLTPAT